MKHSVDWGVIKRINLLGGEPLLIKKSFDVLDQLLTVGNTDCLISFVTNGSVKLTDKQIELFKKFRNINCCVSIDGIESSFDYIRYPLEWTDILKNIDHYRQVFSEVVVSFTVSNLNIHERSKIINWFNSNKLKYIENHVQIPKYFSPGVQPGHALWPDFINHIRQQDTLKGISIDNYIPYVADLINGNPNA